jgi:hypothetical protein
MLKEELFSVTREVLAGPAGRIELGEQRECLAPHRLFHQGRLVQLGLVEHGEETAGFGLDPALATGALDGTLQPVVGESDSRGRRGCDRQNRSGLARQQPLTFPCERFKDCRVVLA